LAQALELIEMKQPSAVQTSMTKLFLADKAVEIVLTCQRVLGAYGYAQGFSMERLVRMFWHCLFLAAPRRFKRAI
jgi:alkylation response protein AidB-like acyl-CoA dehydrogenase